MNNSARLLSSAVLLAAVAVVGWGIWGPARSVTGPAPIEVGEKVEQILPGPDGKPEIWRLERREVEREALAAELLPQPAPPAPGKETRDSARALDAQALDAWRTGRIEEALALFEGAIAADPDDWLPRANLGRLLVMMADHAGAGVHLERAAELNPDSPRVWLDLYSHYQQSLQLERASLAFDRARSLAGDRAIVQDETGLWRMTDDLILP